MHTYCVPPACVSDRIGRQAGMIHLLDTLIPCVFPAGSTLAVYCKLPYQGGALRFNNVGSGDSSLRYQHLHTAMYLTAINESSQLAYYVQASGIRYPNEVKAIAAVPWRENIGPST